MSTGNGKPDPEMTIDIVDDDCGWAYFESGARPPALPDLPRYLSDGMLEWLKAHPERRVRTCLGIVSHGATVGIHLWYDDASDVGVQPE